MVILIQTKKARIKKRSEQLNLEELSSVPQMTLWVVT